MSSCCSAYSYSPLAKFPATHLPGSSSSSQNDPCSSTSWCPLLFVCVCGSHVELLLNNHLESPNKFFTTAQGPGQVAIRAQGNPCHWTCHRSCGASSSWLEIAWANHRCSTPSWDQGWKKSVVHFERKKSRTYGSYWHNMQKHWIGIGSVTNKYETRNNDTIKHYQAINFIWTLFNFLNCNLDDHFPQAPQNACDPSGIQGTHSRQ